MTFKQPGSSLHILPRLPSAGSHSKCLLPAASSRWQHRTWNLFRTGLEKLCELMRQTDPLFRRVLGVGVMTMAVVVILLSTASRRPYTGTNNGSWHTSKASRMNSASRSVGGEAQALRRDSDFECQPRSERKVSSFAFELKTGKLIFILGVDKFRSPPALS